MTTRPMLEALSAALDDAQSELIAADIALMEATARQQAAFDIAARLNAAVAALDGAPVKPSIAVTAIPAENPDKSNIHDLTPEEFDALRKQKQALARKERDDWEREHNPLYHMRCSGCGKTGSMQQTMITAPSGAMVAMKVCSSCNNQIMG